MKHQKKIDRNIPITRKLGRQATKKTNAPKITKIIENCVPKMSLTKNEFAILSDLNGEDTAQTPKNKQVRTSPLYVRQANCNELVKKYNN